jgi:hypothetical protein
MNLEVTVETNHTIDGQQWSMLCPGALTGTSNSTAFTVTGLPSILTPQTDLLLDPGLHGGRRSDRRHPRARRISEPEVHHHQPVDDCQLDHYGRLRQQRRGWHELRDRGLQPEAFRLGSDHNSLVSLLIPQGDCNVDP